MKTLGRVTLGSILIVVAAGACAVVLTGFIIADGADRFSYHFN